MTGDWPTSIGHMTVRWVGDADEAHLPATHLRLERLIGEVDLRPPGMLPGEVLIIAHLRGLPPLTDMVRLSRVWVDGIRMQLADLYHRARHPARGTVPPDTVSVLFADEAELLLCLTRDGLAARAGEHWYWRRVLAPGALRTPGETLSAAWAAYAGALPAVVARLAPDEIRRIAWTLRPAGIAQVVRALHAQFRLPDEVLAVLAEHTTAPPEEMPAIAEAPWTRWCPPGWDYIPPQVELLLGLAAALYHAPAYARTLDFARQTVAWFQAAQRMAPDLTGPAPHPAPAARATEPAVLAPKAAGIDPVGNEQSLSAPADVRTEPRLQLELGGFETRLGGVLYLINLLAWLDLPQGWPGDFASHVSGWGLVEALARGLLAEQHASYAADPLWPALAELDRRAPGDPIAPDWLVRDAFRLPVTWLARFGAAAQAWTMVQGGERLALIDTVGGYLVADVPLAGRDPDEAVTAELEPYHAAGLAVTWTWGAVWPDHTLSPDVSTALGPGLGRWLADTVGFVHDLLARALGPDLTPAQMLCEPGQVMVSQTHVDLFLSLEQIQLPVRRIGLDQDPGWVPDLGFIVLFHYG